MLQAFNGLTRQACCRLHSDGTHDCWIQFTISTHLCVSCSPVGLDDTVPRDSEMARWWTTWCTCHASCVRLIDCALLSVGRYISCITMLDKE